MPRIDPVLVPLVSDLARGLREMGVPFGIVGALIPELLLDARPRQMTNDVDVTVVVQSIADFEALKDRLAVYNFDRTSNVHQMHHRRGGRLDLLPFSEAIAPGGRLRLAEGIVFNMAGFGHVVPNAVWTSIEGGPTLPLAPLPLYALLKLVAFSDRKAGKDLGGVLHCLEHYLEDDERRYGVDHNAEGVPFEYTCAYLLGVDARPFLDEPVSQAVTAVLDRFDDPNAEVIGIVAREKGRVLPEDEERNDIFDRFRWYCLGAGL